MADTVTISTTTDNVTITPAGSNTVTLSSPVSNTVTVALGVGAVNLTGATTDQIAEGSSNLYFSNARASAAAPVQSVVASTGMNILTNAQGDVSVLNTKLGTITGVTMPSGYAVADVSGALTVSYNNLAAVRTGLGLVPGTAANQIVQLDGSAKLPAVDGSALTNLPSAPTYGIANTNAVKVDSTSVADDEYARFTANGLESRSTSEVLSDIGAAASSHTHNASTDITSGTLSVARGGTGLSSISTLLNSNTTKSDVGLGNVENTAISTFAGSSNITTVGTISSGTWSGTAIAYADVSGTPTLGTAAAADTGTGSTNVILGNDSRLDDARTPVAHSADLVTSGTLAVARIPTITLAKVSDAGTAASKDTGTGSTNVILGNDARLTDARTPTTTLDHNADKITTGELAVARGGTGSATAPMVGIITAADAAAARTVLGVPATNHNHATGNITSGTFADARIAASNVTQHADQISIGDLSNVTQTGILATNSGIYWSGSAWVSGALAAAAVPTITLSKISDSGGAAALDVGTSSGTVCAGDDSRLSDDRDPNAHSTDKLTSGTLAVARGGTGVTSLPMVTIPGAADAAAARVVLGVSNVGSYTGQIETAADKTYTLDPGVATDRTITGFFIKSASGTVTATLKVGTAVVKAASVTNTSGDQTSLANTSVTADDILTIVTSSNSSALDVIFAVEYTE